MRQTLFIISFLFSLDGMAQTVEKIVYPVGTVTKPIDKPVELPKESCKCDSGHSCLHYTINTSGFRMTGGHCLPDSFIAMQWKMFHKSMCQETSSGSWSLAKETKTFIPTNHSRQNTWNDDSCTCKTKETWGKLHKGKWVEISEEEYNKIQLFNRKNNKP
jgi:hypothetical protein